MTARLGFVRREVAVDMIDFGNGSAIKLGPTDAAPIATELAPILIDGERIHVTFKGMRDYVAFADKRLIAVNVQGLSGKKRDYSSLPYSRIQTAGRFDFKGRVDIRTIGRLIGQYVLCALP